MLLTFSGLFLMYYSNCINGQNTNLIVEKYFPCHGITIPNQKINFSATPKTFTQPQVFDVNLSTAIPLGNQIRVLTEVDLENKFLDRGWQRLLAFEDDYCRSMQKYGGPFVHDMQTAMGIPAGICPVPKGNYHAINFKANYGRLRMQSFPFGRIRGTIKYFEKPANELLCCNQIIVSNVG